MQHLPVSEESRAALPKIPHLRHGPRYDRQGFDGFLERVGVDESKLVQFLMTYGKDGVDAEHKTEFTRELANSLVQEWFCFGLMHEFEKACGVSMDNGVAMTSPTDEQTAILDTSFLPEYTRKVVIKQLHERRIPLDIQPGDRVRLKYPPFNNKEFEVLDISEPFQYVLKSEDTNRVTTMPMPASVLEHIGHKASSAQRGHESTPGHETLACYDMKTLLGLIFVAEAMDKRYPHVIGTTSDPTFFKCANRVAMVLIQLYHADSQLLYCEITTSLVALCDTMVNVSLRVFRETSDISLPTLRLLAGPERQLLSGWCSSRHQHMIFGSPIVAQCANVIPPFDTQDHSACRKSHCLHHISSSTITPSHTTTCDMCTCKKAEINENMLVAILEDGGNPCLMLAKQDGHECLVVTDTRKTAYVAISHGWAHGLGNSEQNCLHWCQVRKLFQDIRQYTDKSVALWVDTLTVPITPRHKQKALMLLRDVYRNAEAVLVLDKHLQQVGPHPFERALQILGSEWMTRLWTLGESRLTSNLVFLFQDAAVPLKRVIEMNDPFREYGIFQPLGFNDGKMNELLEAPTDITKRLADLVPNLAFRRVTNPLDEPICLATLLGLELEDLGPDLTLGKLYKAMNHRLPQKIIHVSAQRLEEPGLRWAPSTFLTGSLSRIPEYQTGLLDQHGFHVVSDCLFLDPHPELLHTSYRFRAPNENPNLSFAFRTVLEASPFARRALEKATINARNGNANARKQMAILLSDTGDAFSMVTVGALVMLTSNPTLETIEVKPCIYLGFMVVYRNEGTLGILARKRFGIRLSTISVDFASQQKFCFVD